MARKVAPVLTEILDAIEGIQMATARKTFAQFRKDWLLRHGVQRGIEIISEASRHLPARLLDSYPEIEWGQVKGIGSVLRHEYHRVSDTAIWGVVKQKLPQLRKTVAAMLGALDEQKAG